MQPRTNTKILEKIKEDNFVFSLDFFVFFRVFLRLKLFNLTTPINQFCESVSRNFFVKSPFGFACSSFVKVSRALSISPFLKYAAPRL